MGKEEIETMKADLAHLKGEKKHARESYLKALQTKREVNDKIRELRGKLKAISPKRVKKVPAKSPVKV